jgi:hypothetical protein
LLLASYLYMLKTLANFDGEQAHQIDNKMKTFFFAFFIAFLFRTFFQAYAMDAFLSFQRERFWQMEVLLLSPILFDLLPIGSILKLHWQHSIEINEPVDESMHAIADTTDNGIVSRLDGGHEESINSFADDDEKLKVTLDE